VNLTTPIKMSTFNLQYPQTNMSYEDDNGNTRFVTDFKGFTMLRAVSMYSTNDMCKGRAMVYLDEGVALCLRYYVETYSMQ
jgi:hypothetical protein